MKRIALFLKILGALAEDLFILTGLSLIVVATFMLNTMAGIYALGVISLGLGVILARRPPKRR